MDYSSRQSQFQFGPYFAMIMTFVLHSINYLELNPAQASTRAEDSPRKPTIFATEKVTGDAEAAGGAVPPLASNGQGKSNAE